MRTARGTVGTGDDREESEDWKVERTGGEILTLQFGTFSNTIGAHYWNLQRTEVADAAWPMYTRESTSKVRVGLGPLWQHSSTTIARA